MFNDLIDEVNDTHSGVSFQSALVLSDERKRTCYGVEGQLNDPIPMET